MAETSQSQVDWTDIKASGDAAYENGLYRRAAELYDGILKQYSLSPADTNLIKGSRCSASQKCGDWAQAVSDAQSTICFDCTNVTAWFRLGSSLITARLHGEAHEALEVAQQLDPRDEDVKGKLKKARTAVRVHAGKISGPYDDPVANRQLQQSIRQFIESSKSKLAEEQRNTNNFMRPPAESKVEDVAAGRYSAEFSPQTPTMSSQDEIRRTSSTSGSNAANNTFQDMEMEVGPEASASEDSCRELEAELYRARGTEHYKASNWSAACQAYGEAINLAPEVAVYWGNRAAANLMLGKFKAALEDSQKAVSLDPKFSRGYQRAGKALLTMGKLDQAEENYLVAVCLDASDATATQGLKIISTVRSNLEAGDEAMVKGDPRGALWHADSALRASLPAIETALLLKVRALSALGRHSEALSQSRSLTLEGNASSPEVLAIRAGALYCSGNMQLAERAYQEALRMDPDSAACRKGIKRLRSMNSAKEAGNEAFKFGRWGEAHKHYSTAIACDPQLRSTFMVQCYCNRAAALSKLGKHADALGDANSAIDFDPGFAKGYLRRATAYMALKDFESAIRDYEKLKSMAPETQGLGQLLKEAQVELKKAKRIDLYKVLEVTKSASQDEIKKAYRKMALRQHPDKVPDTERTQAEIKFKQLTAAYTLLSDPAKRQKFDAGWSEEEIEQGGMSNGFGGSPFGCSEADLYEHLFSQMRRGGPGGAYSSYGRFY